MFFCSIRTKSLTQVAQHIVAGITMQSYKGAIEALNNVQSNAGYIKSAKIKNNQENNMSEMAKFLTRSGLSLEKLDTLPIIHVAGTNGKGTTCAYSENILRSHGFKTGFYSSPHLLEVRERIRINGKPISCEKFAEHFWKIFTRLDKLKTGVYDMPQYFRFLTLIAFHIFINEKVDVAILEVGIGGEFDCTNIVRKTYVAGITSLDIDHTSLLGNSLESIAWNKGGIMKPGAIVFTAPQPKNAMNVLKARSEERNCELHVIKVLHPNGYNSHIPASIQQVNSSMALAISEAFINLTILKNNNNNLNIKTFDLDLAKRAIATSKWPGRYEIIRRHNALYFLDGAHTLDSIRVCCDWFVTKIKATNPRVLIFNVTGERKPEDLMRVLVKCHFDIVIFIPNVGDDNDTPDTKYEISTLKNQLERCEIHKDLWSKTGDGARIEVLPSFAKAVKFLENQDPELDVLVTGSLHLIGAAMSVLNPDLSGTLL